MVINKINNNNLLTKLLSSGFMTLISRVLGFVRDMITANYFGSSPASDAFFVAFKIPNLLRRIFAEGAFSQAFVPILHQYQNSRDINKLKLFISNILGFLLLSLTIITILGIIAASFIILVTSPGFSTNINQLLQATTLLRIMFPYILFISLSSFMSSLLNFAGYFAMSAFIPSILNLCFIFFVLLLRTYFNGITVLAWAVLVGGILQLLIQIPSLIKLKLLVLPKFNYKDSGVKKVITLMIPAIFAVSVTQIGLLINTAYASFLPVGSISHIYYADRVMEFPVGVFGVAISNILLNNLSQQAFNPIKFSQLLDWGLKLCLMVAIPTSILMGVLAKPIINTLFLRGHFDQQASTMTAQALIGYSLGFTGLLLIKIFAPAFYARQEMKTPVMVAFLTLVFNQIINFILVPMLGASGLTISIGMAACFNSIVLLILLVKKNIYQPKINFIKLIIKILISTIAMAISLKLCQHFIAYTFDHNFLKNSAMLAIYAVIGITSYISTIMICRI